jgi:hypothetical protein
MTGGILLSCSKVVCELKKIHSRGGICEFAISGRSPSSGSFSVIDFLFPGKGTRKSLLSFATSCLVVGKGAYVTVNLATHTGLCETSAINSGHLR